ncbi:hypothetical protein RclHR1_07880003 [Rhizophagus clarus]|uniref:Uncharacterized protein n=1 Tax=Rhizophagus clarus TaxID=94130 RepID=A0A2Z6SMD3_9GLOM|nr:hypothetical protein RclHR1_07880003 [Rhizophagus clarus]
MCGHLFHWNCLGSEPHRPFEQESTNNSTGEQSSSYHPRTNRDIRNQCEIISDHKVTQEQATQYEATQDDAPIQEIQGDASIQDSNCCTHSRDSSSTSDIMSDGDTTTSNNNDGGTSTTINSTNSGIADTSSGTTSTTNNASINTSSNNNGNFLLTLACSPLLSSPAAPLIMIIMRN